MAEMITIKKTSGMGTTESFLQSLDVQSWARYIAGRRHRVFLPPPLVTSAARRGLTSPYAWSVCPLAEVADPGNPRLNTLLWGSPASPFATSVIEFLRDWDSKSRIRLVPPVRHYGMRFDEVLRRLGLDRDELDPELNPAPHPAVESRLTLRGKMMVVSAPTVRDSRLARIYLHDDVDAAPVASTWPAVLKGGDPCPAAR